MDNNQKVHCLFIDDDKDEQDFIGVAIQSLDLPIHFRFEDDAQSALSYLHNQEEYVPDYIFVDLHMPKIDGFECYLQLIEISRLNPSQIFLWSAGDRPGIAEKLAELGQERFLSKPQSLPEIIQLLNDIMSRKGIQSKSIPS